MGYTSSFSVKATCLFVFLTISLVSSQCEFRHLLHLGDGVFDIGNSVAVQPVGPFLPASNSPYGITYPGYPIGRWSNGHLVIDMAAKAMGFPVLKPYLGDVAYSSNAVIFAMARSTILPRSYFEEIQVYYPSNFASFEIQFSWLKQHLHDISTDTEEYKENLGNSLVMFGDVEANDITYQLLQGKSIEDANKTVPLITSAQINAARELIEMGAKKLTMTGNVPIGCYPFVLTGLKSDNPEDYDSLGCLKKVNDLIVYKNNDLKNAITKLKNDFPEIILFYADFYSAFEVLLQEAKAGKGFNKDSALKACCGAGGEYNYNSKEFCGKYVSTCSKRNQYIFWDGIHLTQKANYRLSKILQENAKESLNCTKGTYNAANYLEIKGNKNGRKTYGLSMI